MFCRGRIQRKVQGSSKHLWLLDYLEDGGAGETVSGHGDKPNKITTTIHDRGNSTLQISPYGSLQFCEVYVFPFILEVVYMERTKILL